MTERDLRAELEKSAGPVFYSDLAAHLRRNAVYYVAPGLSLIEAALAIASDDAALVRRHLAKGELRRPTDEELRAWESAEGRTWIAVIVQPFVLVADPT